MSERAKLNSQKNKAKKGSFASKARRPDLSPTKNSTADRVLNLQKTAGNQAVQRLFDAGIIQPKLKIGQPGDKYELEADWMAEQVMRMPETSLTCDQRSGVSGQQSLVNGHSSLYMKEEKPIQITPFIQRQGEEEEELLQTKKVSGQTSDVTSNLESRIQSLKEGGQPLSSSVRNYFEPRLGYDFSHVHVHTDTHAADTARTLNARAFTFGNNVVFGSGQYTPGASLGNKLLAHELTHVVQQTGRRDARHRLGDSKTEITTYPGVGVQKRVCTGEVMNGPGFGRNEFTSKFNKRWRIYNFDINGVFVKQEHKDFIVTNILPKYDPYTFVVVRGHASTTGPSGFNLVLSKDRALCIRDYLRSTGVSSKNVYVSWFGDTTPVVPGSKGYENLLDRAVVIDLYKMAPPKPKKPSDPCMDWVDWDTWFETLHTLCQAKELGLNLLCMVSVAPPLAAAKEIYCRLPKSAWPKSGDVRLFLDTCCEFDEKEAEKRIDECVLFIAYDELFKICGTGVSKAKIRAKYEDWKRRHGWDVPKKPNPKPPKKSPKKLGKGGEPVAYLPIPGYSEPSFSGGNTGEEASFEETDGDQELRSPRFKDDPILNLVIRNLLTLYNGIRGPQTNKAVQKVQRALIDAGFPLPVYGPDGLFGSETEGAVREFQIYKQLPKEQQDGKVGPITLRSLDRHFVRGEKHRPLPPQYHAPGVQFSVVPPFNPRYPPMPAFVEVQGNAIRLQGPIYSLLANVGTTSGNPPEVNKWDIGHVQDLLVHRTRGIYADGRTFAYESPMPIRDSDRGEQLFPWYKPSFNRRAQAGQTVTTPMWDSPYVQFDAEKNGSPLKHISMRFKAVDWVTARSRNTSETRFLHHVNWGFDYRADLPAQTPPLPSLPHPLGHIVVGSNPVFPPPVGSNDVITHGPDIGPHIPTMSENVFNSSVKLVEKKSNGEG